jgi:hypothetical protein
LWKAVQEKNGRSPAADGAGDIETLDWDDFALEAFKHRVPLLRLPAPFDGKGAAVRVRLRLNTTRAPRVSNNRLGDAQRSFIS